VLFISARQEISLARVPLANYTQFAGPFVESVQKVTDISRMSQIQKPDAIICAQFDELLISRAVQRTEEFEDAHARRKVYSSPSHECADDSRMSMKPPKGCATVAHTNEAWSNELQFTPEVPSRDTDRHSYAHTAPPEPRQLTKRQ
jgi:hypothetical protein